jgi:hypothetical protein
MTLLEETLQSCKMQHNKYDQEETKLIRVIKEAYKGRDKISVGNYCFEREPCFLYLGSVIHRSNKMTEEISHSIKKGNRAYYEYKKNSVDFQIN